LINGFLRLSAVVLALSVTEAIPPSKYEADKVLEVGNKIKELKRTHEWFLELASHSPAMHEHLKYDILTVKHGIQIRSPFGI
jgi:hypothetical protein